MTSIFDKINDAALLEYLDLCSSVTQFDKDRAAELARAAKKYYSGDASSRSLLTAGQALEARWYASLAAGQPDYSVYEDDYFLADIWACWTVYSRTYLLSLRSPKGLTTSLTIAPNRYEHVTRSIVEDIGRCETVVDLGCGFGYTTAGLKELFPEAEVYGTNLASPQFNVATELGKQRGFKVVPNVHLIGRDVDVIFASEYFEHFERPIEHLREIITACSPRIFIIANAFGAKSVGHFDVYRDGEVAIANKKIGRRFNATLRAYGYKARETNTWNNRPAYWKLSSSEPRLPLD